MNTCTYVCTSYSSFSHCCRLIRVLGIAAVVVPGEYHDGCMAHELCVCAAQSTVAIVAVLSLSHERRQCRRFTLHWINRRWRPKTSNNKTARVLYTRTRSCSPFWLFVRRMFNIYNLCPGAEMMRIKEIRWRIIRITMSGKPEKKHSNSRCERWLETRAPGEQLLRETSWIFPMLGFFPFGRHSFGVEWCDVSDGGGGGGGVGVGVGSNMTTNLFSNVRGVYAYIRMYVCVSVLMQHTHATSFTQSHAHHISMGRWI